MDEHKNNIYELNTAINKQQPKSRIKRVYTIDNLYEDLQIEKTKQIAIKKIMDLDKKYKETASLDNFTNDNVSNDNISNDNVSNDNVSNDDISNDKLIDELEKTRNEF